MKKSMRKVIILVATIVALFMSAVPAMAATEVPFTKVSLTSAVAAKVGEAKTVTTAPANATSKTLITWTVEDNGAFTTKINGNGTYKNQASSITVTGKKAGTGTITATVKEYSSAGKLVKTYKVKSTVVITADVALKGITLSKTSATINKGNAVSLTVTYNPTNTTASKTITWSTSNSAVATVSGGKVTAKAPGTATITAKCGTKTATCKVTVKAPVTSLKLGQTTATINVGSTLGLSATYAPSNTTDSKTITWTTSNSKVATVSGGRVTAKAAGTATITAKMGTKTATCKVTVKQVAPKFITVTDCYTQLNKYRTSAKVGNLKKDANLEKIAQTRAKELVTSFSHTRPNGKSGLSLISGNIYKGENIAKGQKTCAAVMTAWYNSAGHKANMLNKNFTKVGIAGYEYNGTIYWVTMFSS